MTKTTELSSPIIGFDPAFGEDVACRTHFDKLADGSYLVKKIEYWNKKKECWE